MSMCNTFRLLAVSVALAVSINNASAFTFRRIPSARGGADLIAQETTHIDSKDDLKHLRTNIPVTNEDEVITTTTATDKDETTASSVKEKELTNKENKTSNALPIDNTAVKPTPKNTSLQFVVATLKPKEYSTNNSVYSYYTNDSIGSITNITTHKKTIKNNSPILSDTVKNTHNKKLFQYAVTKLNPNANNSINSNYNNNSRSTSANVITHKKAIKANLPKSAHIIKPTVKPTSKNKYFQYSVTPLKTSKLTTYFSNNSIPSNHTNDSTGASANITTHKKTIKNNSPILSDIIKDTVKNKHKYKPFQYITTTLKPKELTTKLPAFSSKDSIYSYYINDLTGSSSDIFTQIKAKTENSSILSDIIKATTTPKYKSFHYVLTTLKPKDLTTKLTAYSSNNSTHSNNINDARYRSAHIVKHKKAIKYNLPILSDMVQATVKTRPQNKFVQYVVTTLKPIELPTKFTEYSIPSSYINVLTSRSANITTHKKKINDNFPISSHIVKEAVKPIPKMKFLQYKITTLKPKEWLAHKLRAYSTNNSIHSNYINDSQGTSTIITTHKKTSHLQNRHNSTNNLTKTKTTIDPNNEKITPKVIENILKLNNLGVIAPVPRKKYIDINRNGVPDDNKSVTINTRVMALSPTTLQDTNTSGIPSLDQIKHDLFSITPDIKLDHTKYTIPKFTTQDPKTTKTDKFDIDFPVLLSSEIISKENSKLSVESKRAGFLNYSEKNKTSEVADVTKDTNQSVLPYRINNESTKHPLRDSLKYLLLQERVDDDILDKSQDKIDIHELTRSQTSTMSGQNEIYVDNLQPKSINLEKSKNASLYTVSPNYRPLKKMEVQQPKAFVRDPDDNSWRNESISSLGIVFKPKNSSKPFTQVLKNKTETEWNSLLERENKSNLPDLRERLEHITKMRNTKRKKVDSLGNVVYDYEENSSSNERQFLPEETPLSFDAKLLLATTRLSSEFATTSDQPEINSFTPAFTINNSQETIVQTRKPKKTYSYPDYYQNMDNDTSDYIELATIDIKKFNVTQNSTQKPPISKTIDYYKSIMSNTPQRKATLEFFSPTTRKNKYKDEIPIDYDDYEATNRPSNLKPALHHETPTSDHSGTADRTSNKETPVAWKTTTVESDTYLLQPPRPEEPVVRFTVPSEENSKSYAIKYYDDLASEKESESGRYKNTEYDKDLDYGSYAERPQSATTKDSVKVVKENSDENLDYDTRFRKDIISRFVDNFNKNSDKLKSAYPVIFNSSIVHDMPDDGREAATSRAFLRGLNWQGQVPPFFDKYIPHRETIALAPTFEFHYFGPDAEQIEDADHSAGKK